MRIADPEGRAAVVAVGLDPKWFIEQHEATYDGVFTGRAIHKVTHYSPRCNPHFSRFANDWRDEFKAFCQDIRAKYQYWLQREWNCAASEALANDGDLKRLFKWSYEMKSVRRTA